MTHPKLTISTSWCLRCLAFALSVMISGCTKSETPNSRVVVVTDEGASNVNARIIFGLGASDTPAGTAWMMAQAMTEGGSETAQLRTLRATIEATTGREAFVVDVSCPKSNWGQVALLVVQHLTAPMSEGVSIDELRHRQHAALDSLRHDPEDLARAAFWAATDHGTPMAAPPPGTDSSIEAIAAHDLKTFQRQFFTKGNYHLGLAGPITIEEASIFDSRLQELLPPGGREEMTSAGTEPSGLNVQIIELNGLLSASILVGRAPGHRSKDTATWVLAMAAALHGVPDASLRGMDQFLRVERGLVEGVEVESSLILSTRNGVALRSADPSRRERFLVSVQSDPINALYCARIIIKEMTDLNAAGLSQEDIAAMQKLILQSDHPADDATARMQETLAGHWMGVDGFRETEDDGAPLVTSSRARQVIRDAFDPRDLWVIAIVPDAGRFLDEVLSGRAS